MATNFLTRRTSLALASLWVLAGCSGGGNIPALPAPAAIPQANPSAPPAAFSVQPDGSEMPLAMAHLTVGSEGQVSATPVRLNQAIGDAYLVGLNNLDALCDCFRVTGVDREPIATGAKVTLELAFDHPFDLTKRPDLFGWDLKAILATDQNAVNFGAAGVVAPADVVANPAGYTKEWTPQISALLPTLSTNTFPYVILGEDRRAIDPFDFQNPAGWNVFPAGGTNTGSLELNIPTGATYDFDVFFTVGYHVSATRATRQTPDYRPPRGNSRAPWRVDATVTSNTLSPAVGTLASIDLSIWDWQHLQSLSSDVTAIKVWEPTLSSLPPTPAIGSQSGRDLDPITSTFNAVNELGTLTGGADTYVLVEVVDALNGANPGGTGGAPGVLVVGDDFGTITTIDDIRTFQVVPLPVISQLPGVDPIAAVTSTPPMSGGALTITFNTNVLWDASTSSDPDFPVSPEGDIVGYEWDFEWDGIPANFVDDTAGAGTVTENHLYPTPGTTNLGLRVTDGVGRKSTILTVPITISNQTLVLTLDPIQDLSLASPLANNRREFGASLAERQDGVTLLDFTGEIGDNRCVSSIWLGAAFGQATESFSTSNLEFGYFRKSVPNWGRLTCANLVNHTQISDHQPVFTNTFGFMSAAFNLDYGLPSTLSYGYDLAVSRATGHVYAFGDPGTQLLCWRGGPNEFDVPAFIWYSGPVTPTTIDSRPSVVSRTRSSLASAGTAIHIAYRASDGSQLRYAKDPDNDNLALVQTDIATAGAGTYGDPAFDLDENGGAYILVSRFTGTDYQLVVYPSTDLGGTWGTPIPVGANFATRPVDPVLGVKQILGYHVICVVWTTAVDPARGPVMLRWSKDDASFTELQLSAGNDSYSPDVLMTRSSNQFYSAWSADIAARSNVVARHGVFTVQ